ncbi:peptide chain release factor N(5)-glutamine methyltransferase [Algoriphagus litoralis]|uniref:peptide chain release factor N(5)-glutamine methyltransferase n=1 Tax=Algoriphagus litoralis TaxID=2202829 RepID=UPI000DB9EDA1|nr:peptide chain release factor N(5)-glutamine methyltransferase [Algoriphagus litoralis]
MSLSYQQLVKNWSIQLTQYESTEAQNLVNWLLEHHLGLRRVDMMQFLEEKDLSKELKDDFYRLKTGEPIQYILGKGPFYGREFKVSPATLIPRNETEELVHLILKENKSSNLRVLDIGTGTGCIPITLDLEMKNSEVFALDISIAALEIAKENAKTLHAKVSFFTCDILSENPELSELDILVSNPPYIPIEEKGQMHANVLDFEPDLALFVSDEDPLIFYQIIAEKGKKLLKSSGRIYFEINERFGPMVSGLLENLGYHNVRIIQDLNGKDRIVSGHLSG